MEINNENGSASRLPTKLDPSKRPILPTLKKPPLPRRPPTNNPIPSATSKGLTTNADENLNELPKKPLRCVPNKSAFPTPVPDSPAFKSDPQQPRPHSHEISSTQETDKDTYRRKVYSAEFATVSNESFQSEHLTNHSENKHSSLALRHSHALDFSAGKDVPNKRNPPVRPPFIRPPPVKPNLRENVSNLNKLKSISAPDLSAAPLDLSKHSLTNEIIFEDEDSTDDVRTSKIKKRFSQFVDVATSNPLINKFKNKGRTKGLVKAKSFGQADSSMSEESFEEIPTPPIDTTNRFSELHLDLDSQLFDYVVVISLRDNSGTPEPYITFQFPPKFDQGKDGLLESIPQFCFPDQASLLGHGETFSFVLTSDTGLRNYGFCRMIKTSCMKQPEVCCIISPYGLFTLYTQILEEVQFQRQYSSTAVFSFLKTILSKPLPQPNESLNVSFFSSGSNGGIRKVTLNRPGDSAIHEHVQLQLLFEKLDTRIVLELLTYLLTESQLVLCSKSLSTLSSSCHTLISLMYPFEWEHTLIPVLPTKLVDILCLPTPFLLGILPTVLHEIEDLPIENVSIMDLDEGRWIQKSDLKCTLPKNLCNQVFTLLKDVMKLSSSLDQDLDVVDGKTKAQNEIITEIFVQMYLQLMGHFESHYISDEENVSVIDNKAFCKAANSKEQKQFLKEFTPTQAFQKFATTRKQEGPSCGLFENRYEVFKSSKSLDRAGYFKRNVESMVNGFKKKFDKS